MDKKDWQVLLDSCVLKPEGHRQKPAPNDNKRLYTVTTIARPKPGFPNNDRTPVVCDDFNRALEIVLLNYGDINETCYDFVVIEAIGANSLYSAPFYNEKYWFKWEKDKSCYVAIEEPVIYERIFGFGAG